MTIIDDDKYDHYYYEYDVCINIFRWIAVLPLPMFFYATKVGNDTKYERILKANVPEQDSPNKIGFLQSII